MSPSPVHPLSPRLDGRDDQPAASSHEAVSPAAPLFIDSSPPAVTRNKTSARSSPLFPASPKEESIGKLVQESDSIAESAIDEDSSSLRSFRRRTSAATAVPTSDDAPQQLPRQVILPSAPHAISPLSLSQLLPLEQVIALVQALSAQAEAHQLELARLKNEAHVLETLALEKGAGRGEIDRARVRARADIEGARSGKDSDPTTSDKASNGPGKSGEWRMELLRPPDTKTVSDESHKPQAVEVGDGAAIYAGLLVADQDPSRQVMLNLNELADAISDNAYEFGSPVLPDFTWADLDGTLKARRDIADDASSISRASMSSNHSVKSQPLPVTTNSLGVPATTKTGSSGRARHASLSSRIFGSFALPVGASSPPAAGSSLTHSPSNSSLADGAPALTTSPSSRLHKKQHHARTSRSDSIQSIGSNGSGSGTAGGYGEWIWGRGWSKNKRNGHQELPVDPTVGQICEQVPEAITKDDLLTPTPGVSKSLGDNVGLKMEGRETTVTDVTSSSDLSTTKPTELSTPLSPSPSTSPSLSRESSSLHPPNSPTLSRSSLSDARRPSFTERGNSPEPAQAEVVKIEVLAQDIAGPAQQVSQQDQPSEEGSNSNSDQESTIRARRSSTGSKRVPVHLSVATSSSESKGYVASAKGTLGRAFGLAAKTATSPKMTRSASDGLKRAPGFEPKLTMFPRLASMSQYSPFAQPHLSTPLTPVSLSSRSAGEPVAASSDSHTSAGPVPHMTTAPTISAPATMELSTLSAEAAPPTMRRSGNELGRSAHVNGADSGNAEGPLVDRYGFVYDVRSGMKLLREARRHKERLAKGETLTDADPALAAAAKVLDNEATAEAGSTPEQVPERGATEGLQLAPQRPAQLVRSMSSSSDSRVSTSSATPGPASMKLLLTTLKDMSDALEKSQKAVWDSFIRRRQDLLASSREDPSIHHAASHSKQKRHDRRRKAANRANRPRTIAHDLNTLMNDAFQGQDDANDQAFSEEKEWTEDLVGVSQMGLAGKNGKEDWAEFKELVRRGVPIAYRPKIWAECSGANEAREPGLYQDLLTQHRGEENQCLNQIDMDCHRTFPTNVFFAGNGPGVAKLRNVLVAYSWRNPKIGYCQGMNNLTATLLLTYPSEEEAFWVLVCIIEKILPSDYYTSHLLVSQADQRVLKDLIEKLMPEVTAHLEDLGVELPAVTFGWFLSLFTDSLPIQTLLRIWDLIFVLGTVMLFRVAVAIIQMNRDEILACDSAASLYALMRSMTAHLYQVDKLLKIACEELRPLIKDRDISALRNKHAHELQIELGIEVEAEMKD